MDDPVDDRIRTLEFDAPVPLKVEYCADRRIAMALFRVRLKGLGFLREGARSGFYANRFVDAHDAQAAVGVAIASLQTRADIWRPYVEGRSEDGAPTFEVDEVQEVEGPAPREQGLVWFPMD